jgi:hypothetical protein
MAQLSASRIFNALAGLFSSTDSTDEALLKTALWRKTIHCHVTDGGTAGTAQTETVVWRNDTGATVKVVSAHVIAPVAVTANATNYATFLVYKRSSAGASQATIGTFATDTVTTDDMTAFAPKELTLTVANVEVAAGAVITCAVTKTAAGVAIAAATSQARVQIVVEPIGS